MKKKKKKKGLSLRPIHTVDENRFNENGFSNFGSDFVTRPIRFFGRKVDETGNNASLLHTMNGVHQEHAKVLSAVTIKRQSR